jgi:hypothetical protein
MHQAGQGATEFATLLYRRLDAALDDSLAAIREALPVTEIQAKSGNEQ